MIPPWIARREAAEAWAGRLEEILRALGTPGIVTGMGEADRVRVAQVLLRARPRDPAAWRAGLEAALGARPIRLQPVPPVLQIEVPRPSPRFPTAAEAAGTRVPPGAAAVGRTVHGEVLLVSLRRPIALFGGADAGADLVLARLRAGAAAAGMALAVGTTPPPPGGRAVWVLAAPDPQPFLEVIREGRFGVLLVGRLPPAAAAALSRLEADRLLGRGDFLAVAGRDLVRFQAFVG